MYKGYPIEGQSFEVSLCATIKTEPSSVLDGSINFNYLEFDSDPQNPLGAGSPAVTIAMAHEWDRKIAFLCLGLQGQLWNVVTDLPASK